VGELSTNLPNLAANSATDSNASVDEDILLLQTKTTARRMMILFFGLILM
jgi:hypothetical protein